MQFAALSPEVIERVVDKFILELEVQLEERHVHLSISDETRKWLAERGYDPTFGARPLARVIQEHIKKPLADELLFGKLVQGGDVKVLIEDNKPAFQIVSHHKGKDGKPGKGAKKAELV